MKETRGFLNFLPNLILWPGSSKLMNLDGILTKSSESSGWDTLVPRRGGGVKLSSITKKGDISIFIYLWPFPVSDRFRHPWSPIKAHFLTDLFRLRFFSNDNKTAISFNQITIILAQRQFFRWVHLSSDNFAKK